LQPLAKQDEEVLLRVHRNEPPCLYVKMVIGARTDWRKMIVQQRQYITFCRRQRDEFTASR
jgi:hypothetical protein